MFLVSLWLISDEPLLSGQPLTSGYVPLPQGCLLNRGSTAFLKVWTVLMVVSKDVVQ